MGELVSGCADKHGVLGIVHYRQGHIVQRRKISSKGLFKIIGVTPITSELSLEYSTPGA